MKNHDDMEDTIFEVKWNRADIARALEDNDIEPTDANIDKYLENFDIKYFGEQCIQHGIKMLNFKAQEMKSIFLESTQKENQITIPLSIILEAFEMSNDEWEYLLDLEKMETVWLCDPHINGEYEEYEALVEQMEEYANRFIRLPSQYELHPYKTMESFVYSLPAGGAREKLERAIQGRGAFRRFKDTAYNLDVIDQWYQYEADAQRRKAIQWCEEHDFGYKE